MSEIHVFVAYLQALNQTARSTLLPDRSRGETGAGVAETVILVAILAAGAIAIGTIIISKFTGKANSIPTGP